MISPSRNSNPFATCWTNPQAMEWLSGAGPTPAFLAERLAALCWQGQIVGPHGAGKSTLLATLRPLVERRGRAWVGVRLGANRSRQAWHACNGQSLGQNSLLVVDGFEQLRPIARRLLRWRCARHGAGLLVTTHRSMGLPTLVALAPDVEVAKRVFRQLVTNHQTRVTEVDVTNAFNACNGNIRDTLLDLYDRHERYQRTTNVANLQRASFVRSVEPIAAQ